MSEKKCSHCGGTDLEARYLGLEAAEIARVCLDCGHYTLFVEDLPERVPDKTLRDEFAMAALTGLLARMRPGDVYSHGGASEAAYSIADAMMQEREKTNAI